MATYRYRSRQGKLVDINLEESQRFEAEKLILGKGFAFIEKDPKDTPPRMSAEELTRILSGKAQGTPQLMGPQPNGTVGPV